MQALKIICDLGFHDELWFADHVIMELEGLAPFITLWSWEEFGFCPQQWWDRLGYIWDHSLSLNSKLGAGFDLCKAKKYFSLYFYI